MTKKRIAFVIQRYGVEVNGGAELHCLQLVERLQPYFDVTVLTTCAIDYYSWKNEYRPGLSTINGVAVQRFRVDYERNKRNFDTLSEKAFADSANLTLGEEWMRAQGPYSSELLAFIKDHQNDYEKIVFFTYLYATTYFGMRVIQDSKKIVLIPTAHDEPPIYLKIFESVFKSPACIIYNTETEWTFIQKRFKNTRIHNTIAGLGIEFPPRYKSQVASFKKRHALGPYVIYVGRIDESKGCHELFSYFLRYKKLTNSNLKLVLMGKAAIEIPDHPDIVSLGFVEDQEKWDGIQGAEFAIIPSPYESLSMSLLEAFLRHKAALVNGRCEVLKNHCLSSQAGLWYQNELEFKEAIHYLLTQKKQRKSMEENGHRYVMDRYQWDPILKSIMSCLERPA